MSKLLISPTQDSYSSEIPRRAVAVDYDGGATRFREDLEGEPEILDATWVLAPMGYDYFMAFFRARAERGAIPFEIDIVGDDGSIEEFSARILPGSLRLSQKQGEAYFVQAALEIRRPIRDEVADLAIVGAYAA